MLEGCEMHVDKVMVKQGSEPRCKQMQSLFRKGSGIALTVNGAQQKIRGRNYRY